MARLACLIAVGLCVATTASATIVDSEGFESPIYGLGDLAGQHSWSAAGAGGGTAVVQDTEFLAGSQALQVDRGANSDDRWFVSNGGQIQAEEVIIEWDMKVMAAPAGPIYGPFFGIEACDYSPSGPFGLLGTLGVDATTGDVLYQEAATGGLAETGTTVAFGEWNHYKIALDFVTDQYSVFLNDTELASDGFVDSFIGNDLNYFTSADIAALAAFGDPGSLAGTGTAYIDNYVVTPEPSSLILVLTGIVGMFLWRTRRR